MKTPKNPAGGLSGRRPGLPPSFLQGNQEVKIRTVNHPRLHWNGRSTSAPGALEIATRIGKPNFPSAPVRTANWDRSGGSPWLLSGQERNGVFGVCMCLWSVRVSACVSACVPVCVGVCVPECASGGGGLRGGV